MKCNFCGKDQAQVKKLVSSGDDKYAICDECLKLCNKILDEEGVKRKDRKIKIPPSSSGSVQSKLL